MTLFWLAALPFVLVYLAIEPQNSSGEPWLDEPSFRGPSGFPVNEPAAFTSIRTGKVGIMKGSTVRCADESQTEADGTLRGY